MNKKKIVGTIGLCVLILSAAGAYCYSSGRQRYILSRSQNGGGGVRTMKRLQRRKRPVSGGCL